MTEDTRAILEVAASGVPFRVVRTERPGSAEESAELQGIELGQLIRSIVVRRRRGDYVFVLVPGGRQIAWPGCARTSVSRLSLPDQEKPATRPATSGGRSPRSRRRRAGRSWPTRPSHTESISTTIRRICSVSCTPISRT
ncbi:MAG: hypothetical protein K0R20_878 [Actinomycetia bacterium]|nr:hypothetical protein [Actinomycetes bacterium]